MRNFILIFAGMLLMGCSGDDSTATTQNTGPQSKNEIIDWISGDAHDIGLYLSSDEFRPFSSAGMSSYDISVKIVPKPGYEDIPYTVIFKDYFPQENQILRQEAVGETTAARSIPAVGTYTFHMYMTDAMEYDAYLTIVPHDAIQALGEKTAIGHERQDN